MLDLEARGASFRLEDAGRFRVIPPSILTADDRVFLQAHRDRVRECIEYIERIAERPI